MKTLRLLLCDAAATRSGSLAVLVARAWRGWSECRQVETQCEVSTPASAETCKHSSLVICITQEVGCGEPVRPLELATHRANHISSRTLF